MDSSTVIPKYISKIGLFTGQFMLITTIVSFFYNYYGLMFMSLLLYITTLLHWNNVKESGLIRNLDMSVSGSTIIFVTFSSSYHFIPIYRTIWVGTMSFGLLVYGLNQTVFYYQIQKKSYTIMTEQYKYFSFKYTEPNSYQRIMAHYWTTYLHTCFLHVCPCMVVIVSVIMS
jgi:hypothetical protein